MVSSGRKIALYTLSGVAILTFAYLELTSRTGVTSPGQSSSISQSTPTQVVDEEPLATARGVSNLPSTADEERLANEIVRVADQEVDLAYASALRQAQLRPEADNPKFRELGAQVRSLQGEVQNDQEQVDELKKAAAKGDSGIADRLEVAQAQLTLHQDQLDDAKQDLIRAGGDPASRVQQQLSEHEAREHVYDTAPPKVSNLPTSFETEGSLLAQYRTWRRLRWNRHVLLAAQQRATDAAKKLSSEHDTLGSRSAAEAQQAGPTATSEPDRKTTQATAMASLRAQSQNSKTSAEYDKRILQEQRLAQLYGEWASIVEAQLQLSKRAILRSLLWILLALLVLTLVEVAIAGFYTRNQGDNQRVGAVRLVLRHVTQIVGVLIILLVVLGPPKQLSTVLALAGAGLTVALKDFIVAFFGWFVLMGKNGIRVGDWVEINGVGGEVSHVGLLRTILLETGNWNDAGHPTGRKVSFVNSFAIEGHYFNFTTAGQWLWDELDVLIPTGQNPYEITEEVLRIITEETKADAARADQEWRRITNQSFVQSSSTAPAINVRPTNLGINLVVRYVVQAHTRYEVRTRLYEKIVSALHRNTLSQASKE